MFSLQKEANKIHVKYKLMTLPKNENLICQLKKSLESEKQSKIANKPLTPWKVFQTFRGNSQKQRIKCEVAH